MENNARTLQDVKVNIRIKLSALWTSVMFCYIYADYFGLYAPGRLQSMLDGKIVPLGPVTEGILVFTSVMLAIPALMIFLSVVLKPAVDKWLNIVVGAIYTGIIGLTMWDYAFSIFYGVIEIALTLLVIFCAWHWPRGATEKQ